MVKGKRKMILAAANDCFTKFGYKKTTLEDIGKSIGISKASIYYYFKSKAEIYITMVTNKYDDLIANLHEEIESYADCESKIFGYFDKRLDWLYEQSSLLTHITQEELKFFNEYGSNIVNEIIKKEKQMFTDILQECIKKKIFPKFDITRISNNIFILADGIFNFYRSPENIEIITQNEISMIKKEVSDGLTIFLNGLKR